MNEPRLSHMTAAKHVLRYLKGTAHFGLLFSKMSSSVEGTLEVWSDSDWCKDKVDRRSTFGYFIKYTGAPISWCSKKQSVVALSSFEAECIASAETDCQCVWLEELLGDLRLECRKPIQLLVDNKSAISLSKNPVFHGRSKHIETKLSHCSTENQVADVFTKALRQNKFERLRELLNVIPIDSLV